MSKPGRVQWYRIAEDIPLSAPRRAQSRSGVVAGVDKEE